MISEAASEFVKHEAARQVGLLSDLKTKLQNDPAAALAWESAKLAFGHAYDAAEVMFGHEDAEELVEIAIKRLSASLDASMAQSARMRRLTLQARDRLIRQALKEDS